jgi:hypothetical protein
MVAVKKQMLPFAFVWAELTKRKNEGFNEFRVSVYQGDKRHAILKSWRRVERK